VPDPLTGLALSAGDFAALAARSVGLAPRSGRTVVFLEGGYDLTAVRDSVAATLPALVGEPAQPGRTADYRRPGRRRGPGRGRRWAASP